MTDLPAETAATESGHDDVAVDSSPGETLSGERREALLADSPEEVAARAPGVVETGNAEVDAVLASLEGLDSVPVDEHVALFEQAHEKLRRTLSGASEN